MTAALLAALLASPARAASAWAVAGDVLTVPASGYMQVCLDDSALYKKDGAAWRKADTELPPKGLYYLDGKFVGYGACDYVTCSRIEAPRRVRLVEFRKAGEKAPPESSGSTAAAVPVFESVPLKGRLRYELRYFSDAGCRKAEAFTASFTRR